MRLNPIFSKKLSILTNRNTKRIINVLLVELIVIQTALSCVLPPNGKAGPLMISEDWSDTFDNTNGVEFSYNVNISDGDAKLKEYRNKFNEETVGKLPVGWTREYSSSNYIIVRDYNYEPGRAVFLHCNDDRSSFAWQKLWIEYNEYYQFWEFDLTLFSISVETERQGYFYIEFYAVTDDVYHEVRYYWDDVRSGTPSSSTSLTAVDLGFVLPTGTDLGTKFLIYENISEDIEANPQADLTSVLGNITKVRYGFYQDAGPGWDRWEQVYIDNMGIYNDNFGYLTSTEISLPLGYNWGTLQINKTEPNAETYVNVSILDGNTKESIPGFEEMTGININMSSIDPITHPNIRLLANFTGTGNATPVLHDWVISWEEGDPLILDAIIDIDPDTLNLKSKGKWITCYIELPEGYDVRDIIANTILLEDSLSPILDPKYGFVKSEDSYIMDHDNDTMLERMVKFDRSDVEDMLSSGSYNLKIFGELNDGTEFEGLSDTIRVIDP